MPNPRNATTTNRGRTYRWRDEQFDSVTTIIGGGVPKPALKAWGEKLVAQTAVEKRRIWSDMSADEAVDWLKRAPFRETDRAAVQGTDVHDWCEKHVLGGLPVVVEDAPPAQQGYLKAFLSFLTEHHPEYEMTEATVYNRHWGYAGTLDFLARIDGRFVLGDYKTGKGVYGEVAMQLAAYRNAEFIGMPNGDEVPMPDVDECMVLHLMPTGYELLPVTAGDSEFRYFLYAKQVRDFVETHSRAVIGAPLVLPQDPPRPSLPPNIAALVD